MNSTEIDVWKNAYIRASQDPDLLSGPGEHPLWWAVERAMFAMGETEAEHTWRFILAVLEKNPPDRVLGSLAAGPLEEFIAGAGAEYMQRIEIEARRNPGFKRLLGGVWQNATPDDIWRRIEVIAGRRR